jgi:hypothetical protein
MEYISKTNFENITTLAIIDRLSSNGIRSYQDQHNNQNVHIYSKQSKKVDELVDVNDND